MNKRNNNPQIGNISAEELLSAFFDGEVEPSVKAALEASVVGGDRAVLDELQSLSQVRAGIRSWHESQTVDFQGREKRLDVWSAIADEVNSLAERKKAGAFRFVPRWSDALRSILSPRFAVGLALLAVTVVSVASLRISRQIGVTESQNSQVASSRVDNLTTDLQEAINTLPVKLDSRSPLSMSESMAGRYRSRIGGDLLVPVSLGESNPLEPNLQLSGAELQMRLPVSQIMDDNFVQGGLRTNGADIKWIRSQNAFRILPGGDRSAPPVIWVANRR